MAGEAGEFMIYKRSPDGSDALAFEVSCSDASNWVGQWHGFAGTVFSQNQFLTARHIGGNIGDTFTLGGVDHVVTGMSWFGDVAAWTFSDPVQSYAPMAQTPSEVGRYITAGYGMGNGAQVLVGDRLAGYEWAPADGGLHWGEVNVQGVGGWQLIGIFSKFDTLRFDVSMAPGDSGSPIFAQQADGSWALAGVGSTIANQHNGMSLWGDPTTPYPLLDDGDRSYFADVTGQPLAREWMASQVTPVPEPSTIALLACALVVAAYKSRLSLSRLLAQP